MRILLAAAGVVLGSVVAAVALAGGPTSGEIVLVELPEEDAMLAYVERESFTVQLETATASVECQRMYVGDGKVAVELVADPSRGIFLQGRYMRNGDRFLVGSTVEVLPGYLQADELQPGDVYVILPGVTFKLPE